MLGEPRIARANHALNTIRRTELEAFLDSYPVQSTGEQLIAALAERFELELIPRIVINATLDAPIGTPEERAQAKIWPGEWQDANPFGNLYEIQPGVFNYHTGADLNLNRPTWNLDKLAPVYAIGSGVVTFAGRGSGTWGNLVVIRHDPLPDGRVIWSRSAHLYGVKVITGDQVVLGQEVGLVGDSDGRFSYHLHFDIAVTNKLELDPSHWPGRDYTAVQTHYVDPRKLLLQYHIARV